MNEKGHKRVGRVKGTPNKPKYTAILKKYVDRQALILANAWDEAERSGRGPVVDGARLNAFYTGVIALEMVKDREKREKEARKGHTAAEDPGRDEVTGNVATDDQGRPTLLI